MTNASVPSDKPSSCGRWLAIIVVTMVVVGGALFFLAYDGFRAARDGRPAVQIR